jgi:ubiquinone/menaquinone biosynthesis C-methylase UbiE
MTAEGQIAARKAGTAAIFSRVAENYDRVGPRYFSYFGRRLVELAELRPGAKVLDLATGRGAVLFPALEKIGPEGQVTGIDLAQGMVERTSQDLSERGIGNARVLLMDAEQLELADNSFDFALCGFGLFFFPQVQKALSEVYRVLKPGGWLGATTWGAPDERWNWIAEVGLRPKPQPGAKHAAHDDNPIWLENALKQTPFVDYRAIEERADFVFANEDEWWASQWTHGARSCLERLQPEALEEAREAAYKKLAALKQPGGIPLIQQAIYSFARKPE